MTVTGQVKLTKEGISLRGSETTLEQLRKKFLKKETFVLLKVEFEDEEPYKSYPQLGYIYNELGVKAMEGYTRLGYAVRNRNIAVDLLKIEPDIEFVEYVINESNGDIVGRLPKSLKTAKIKEVSEFIERAIAFIIVDMRLDVSTPDEFFKALNIYNKK